MDFLLYFVISGIKSPGGPNGSKQYEKSLCIVEESSLHSRLCSFFAITKISAAFFKVQTL